jgi:lysophospholipase L1-like esterase
VRVLSLIALVAGAGVPHPAGASSPILYVALGDSTATGVGAEHGGGYPDRLARRLGASGVPVRLLNLGVPGATAEDVRRTQLPRVVQERPALVTIGIGLNDLVRGRSLRDFARDLHVIADLVERTQAAVIVSELPDVSRSPSAAGSPASLRRRVAAYNAAIRQTAERHGFEVAPVEAVSRRAVSEEAGVFAPDGFHPSARGYELWADALWPAIERALGARVQGRRGSAPGGAQR